MATGTGLKCSSSVCCFLCCCDQLLIYFLGNTLYRALMRARDFAYKTRSQFIGLSQLTDEDLVKNWCKLSTLPQRHDGEWTSVYRHHKNKGLPSYHYNLYIIHLFAVPNQADVYRHMLAEELKDADSRDVSKTPAAIFINTAIKLQNRQYVIWFLSNLVDTPFP